jgi:hypothetical protein
MANLTPKEKALLNKVYRAVHDSVCPACGSNMFHPDEGTTACSSCKFTVFDDEMLAMRPVIEEWGKEAVAFFNEWRRR